MILKSLIFLILLPSYLLGNSFLSCTNDNECGIQQKVTCCQRSFKPIYLGKNPPKKRYTKTDKRKFCSRVKCKAQVGPDFVKKVFCDSGVCKIDPVVSLRKECNSAIGDKVKCLRNFQKKNPKIKSLVK